MASPIPSSSDLGKIVDLLKDIQKRVGRLERPTRESLQNVSTRINEIVAPAWGNISGNISDQADFWSILLNVDSVLTGFNSALIDTNTAVAARAERGANETITGAWNFTSTLRRGGVDVADLTAAQTLNNKTMNTPILNNPFIVGERHNTTTVTASTTMTTAMSVYLCNSTSAITMTLPTASNGQRIIVKNINTGVVTVARAGSSTIDGATSYALSTQWSFVDLQAVGTNWFVVGKG